MKQTAVEFLIEEIECRGLITKELRLCFTQAKEMEKEQIENSFIEGVNTIYAIPKNFDEYWQETYGGNK